jgi:hypothetical protein
VPEVENGQHRPKEKPRASGEYAGLHRVKVAEGSKATSANEYHPTAGKEYWTLVQQESAASTAKEKPRLVRAGLLSPGLADVVGDHGTPVLGHGGNGQWVESELRARQGVVCQI